MSLRRPSTTVQRVLGSAVVSLVAANAFAAAVLVGSDDRPDPRPATTSESAAPAAVPQTVVLITTRDGRRLLADPNTADGRKAIADATRDGGTVRTIPVPARTGAPGSGPTLPGLDLGRLAGNGSGGSVGGVVAIGQEAIDKLLDDDKTTTTSTVDPLKDTITTVSSIVGSTPSTITSIVESTPSTITSIVQGVPTTLPPLTVPAPVSSILNQVTPTTSLLGGVVTTVSSLVQSVQQQAPSTTTPPAPPTTLPPVTVCGLLVHC